MCIRDRLLIVVGVVGMVLAAKAITRRSSTFFLRQQVTLAKAEAFMEEMMTGQKVIKVFCHEDEARKDFDRVNGEIFYNARNGNRFANILMPDVYKRQAEHLLAYSQPFTYFRKKNGDDGQKRIHPVAQGRDLNRKDIYTVVQVLPEKTLDNKFGKIPVGGCNEPDISSFFLFAAYAEICLVLKDFKQLALQRHRCV